MEKVNNNIEVTEGLSFKTKCLLILPLPQAAAKSQLTILEQPRVFIFIHFHSFL